jgi:hypothetical protein
VVAPGLYFSAAAKRAARVSLSTSKPFGNAWSKSNDARRSSMASWTMTRMRGFWADKVSLLLPGMRYKSVSLEGNAGVEGFETFPVLAFTGVEDTDEPDELEAPTEPDGLEVPDEPEVPEASPEPDGSEVPDEPEVPEAPTEPAEPEVPDEPEVPEAPTEAAEPEVPAEPEKPEVVRATPVEPKLPNEPGAPDGLDVPDVLAGPSHVGRFASCYKLKVL